LNRPGGVFLDSFLKQFPARMNDSPAAAGEGGLQAPTRHPIDWKNPDFYDRGKVFDELERVFDLCHGCRRCVSLCNAFPTLFDLVDESKSMEIDGVARDDYWKVVDHCYLCDMCYISKCPYIPPHPWNIDFPHLMLRAKAVKHRDGGVRLPEKILASTDAVGKLASIPIVVNAVNAANQFKPARQLLKHTLGVHPQAGVPKYHKHGDTLRRKHRARVNGAATGDNAAAGDSNDGKVVLVATCYGNYNEPRLGDDLIAVLEHNGVAVALAPTEQCCGMPNMELGDLRAVEKSMRANIPGLAKMVADGCDIIAPVPSCALMLRQEWPLLFPEDADVQRVAAAVFDPFEYLMARHREGRLNTDFKTPLGKVAYHAACHQRVQKIGMQTRACLQLVPGTEVTVIERCSGHNGTYGVKNKSYLSAKKIGRPVVNKIKQAAPDHYASDCPMAGRFIEHGMADGSATTHPVSLLRRAYSI